MWAPELQKSGNINQTGIFVITVKCSELFLMWWRLAAGWSLSDEMKSVFSFLQLFPPPWGRRTFVNKTFIVLPSSAQCEELYGRLPVVREHVADGSWDHVVAQAFIFCQNKQTSSKLHHQVHETQNPDFRTTHTHTHAAVLLSLNLSDPPEHVICRTIVPTFARSHHSTCQVMTAVLVQWCTSSL